MANDRTMSSKVSRLFLKWTCFGGRTTREDVDENNLRINHPKIIITECKSVDTSPNVSRKESSRSSSSSSSESYDETETEIQIKTDGNVHEMGMNLVLKMRECSEDNVDGGGRNEVTTMISVSDIKVGSFAHGFGVRKGDMISKINGKGCDRVQEIKEAFLYKNSSELEMEVFRKARNQKTGGTELIKMVISNARRVGGTTENELEIIQVEMGSNWSLSDNEKYFRQDHVNVTLQFASNDIPFVIRDGYSLALNSHLPASEEENARFHIHRYWSMSTTSETGFPVVIQHAMSGLCVAFDHKAIHLEKVDNLETIEGNTPFLFFMHTELDEGSGMNITFRSLLDRSRYIGFNVHGYSKEEVHAEPIHVKPTYQDPLGDEHKNIVFIVTYL